MFARYDCGVKKRSAIAVLLLSLVALLVGACNDKGSSSGGAVYGYTYAGCSQYTSCQACTPVNGCGWCDKIDGTGMCADDPNDCAAASAFRWTWDLMGCRVTADAGVSPTDAAAESDGIAAE